ncbi:2-C-methyl-D-erythritol 4-phosphate cytidylyltransferase [Halarsenatibacter silvermanii]|nr:2-C-methyl-D-erythritol 4-phosphate cytidylyltransferase [Halarsenatibacter silvermanii]
MSSALIVAAAGEGRRMKKEIRKQYLPLRGKPLLARTLSGFAGWCDKFSRIIVVIPPGDEDYFEEGIIPQIPAGLEKRIEMAAGGTSRQESVNRGLKRLNDDIDYVFIHDGARPFFSEELMEGLFEAVRRWGAATAATPVKDTIKQKNNKGLVENTLDRDKLVAVQTPQAFSCDLIKTAHRRAAGKKFPDDASLVEEMGREVRIVRGNFDNIKLTTPLDLKLAEAILAGRQGEDFEWRADS